MIEKPADLVVGRDMDQVWIDLAQSAMIGEHASEASGRQLLQRCLVDRSESAAHSAWNYPSAAFARKHQGAFLG